MFLLRPVTATVLNYHFSSSCPTRVYVCPSTTPSSRRCPGSSSKRGRPCAHRWLHTTAMSPLFQSSCTPCASYTSTNVCNSSRVKSVPSPNKILRGLVYLVSATFEQAANVHAWVATHGGVLVGLVYGFHGWQVADTRPGIKPHGVVSNCRVEQVPVCIRAIPACQHASEQAKPTLATNPARHILERGHGILGTHEAVRTPFNFQASRPRNSFGFFRRVHAKARLQRDTKGRVTSPKDKHCQRQPNSPASGCTQANRRCQEHHPARFPCQLSSARM